MMKNKSQINSKKELKELKEYEKFLEEASKNFNLTPLDLSNLYDLFYMVTPEFDSDLKINKMYKWFNTFFDRLDKIVISEKEERNKILTKLKKENKNGCL